MAKVCRNGEVFVNQTHSLCLSETWEREEGMLAYCLFETYGFPLVFAVDEMERYGMPVDEAGFHIMTELARQRNKNTFKGKDAFG